jgi:Flp pilus assembly protein TadD
VRTGREAVRWLNESAQELERYAASGAQSRATVADALLYLARAHVHLADAEPGRAPHHLARATTFADRAAALDPHDPEIPIAQAIIALRRDRPLSEARALLATAARLSPAEDGLRLDLAALDSAEGAIDRALLQLDRAEFVHQATTAKKLQAARPMRETLINYKRLME